MSQIPSNPKIYHIIHVDKLASIVSASHLYSDKIVQDQELAGTNIGMSGIKNRRMVNTLRSHPSLCVGECVPFYFCPRSVMLFMIYRGNHPELPYKDGQDKILHLESNLYQAINWAEAENLRWAFTLSNAGAHYFEDRANINDLKDINWDAVSATQWSGQGISSMIKEGKQAEFLIEQRFPWSLVSTIGIPQNEALFNRVNTVLRNVSYRPSVIYKPDWYY